LTGQGFSAAKYVRRKSSTGAIKMQTWNNAAAGRALFPDLLGFPPLSRTQPPVDVLSCASIGRP